MTYVKFNATTAQQDFNKMLQEMMGTKLTSEKSFNPPVNIFETEKHFELELLVPGYQKEEITLTLEKGLFTIAGNTKNNTTPDSTKKMIRNEFKTKAFKRTFNFEDTIDTDHIEATYEQGILRIILQKKQQDVIHSKTIQIK